MSSESSIFVGRADLLDALRRSSAQAGDAFELVGDSGTGKTAIVRELRSDDRSSATIHIDLESYDPCHPNDRGDTASVGSVQASFQQFTRLLTRLIELTRGDEAAAAFAEEVRDAYQAEVAEKRVFSLELAMQDVSRELTPRDLADAWRASKDLVAASFLARWNAEPDKGAEYFLVFDNVDDVIDEEMGLWLGQLLPKLHHTVILLTRRSSEVESLVPPERKPFETLRVGAFTKEEVRAYLSRREGALGNRLVAERIFRITDGHPGTVAVIHDLLQASGVARDVDAVLAVLGEAENATGERIAHLVERLVHAQPAPGWAGAAADYGALLWRAVQAAAVTRHFDAALLDALLDDEDRSVGSAKVLLPEMVKLGFVEPVDRPDVPAETIHRVYRYVRDDILDRMIKYESTRYSTLHQRAARFYADQLVAEDRDGRSELPFGYGDAYTYEDPGWQSDKREWLYHRAHAENEAHRREAVLESARIFLEAFWWWGNYIRFDFCDQLVADLGQMLRRQRNISQRSAWGELELLHDALGTLVQEYPPRSTKRQGNWDSVRASLLQIADACGVSHPRACRSAPDFKVRALLDIFLAHTYRYSDPDHPKADLYYVAAAHHLGEVARLEGEGTDGPPADWNLPWVHFERAELNLERSDRGAGEDEELRELWQSAADLLQRPPGAGEVSEDPLDSLYGPSDGGGELGEDDEELVANLHRLRGDRCWHAGDRLRAATWYRRALLHAYLFQSISTGERKTYPDEYTLQFYVDVRAVVLTRIEAMVAAAAGGGEQDAAALVQFAVEVGGARHHDLCDLHGHSDTWRDRLTEELTGRIAGLGPVERSELLFPPGPRIEDLGQPRSSYMDLHRAASEIARQSGTPGHDLHDPRWP